MGAYVCPYSLIDPPEVAILLLSFAEALIPTLTLSLIPSTIPASVCGIAFGVLSIVDSIAVFCGNIFFGYLYQSTHSYKAGLAILCGLSVVSFCLILGLTLCDCRYNWARRHVIEYWEYNIYCFRQALQTLFMCIICIRIHRKLYIFCSSLEILYTLLKCSLSFPLLIFSPTTFSDQLILRISSPVLHIGEY